MEGKNLRFRKILIRKMPGLQEGLRPFENLSPGINIIAGPNASGKSSTARAIRHLIWGGQTGRTAADGEFEVGDEQWRVTIDHSFRRMQREGTPSELAGIPPVEHQSRYMLSLHELIRKDEGDLASHILKDAVGGYDLEKARENLGYKSVKSSRNVKEYQQFDDADNRVREITEEQEQLQKERQKLNALRKQRDQAAKARLLADFFERVEEYKNEVEKLEQLKSNLKEYPDVLENVRVEDDENAGASEKKIRQADEKIRELEETVEALQEKTGSLQLPDSGVDPVDIRTLNKLSEELREKEKAVAEGRRQMEEERVKRDEVARKLNISGEMEKVDDIRLPEIERMEQFWQEAFDDYGEFRALRDRLEEISHDKKETADSDTLRSGIEILARWLRTGGGAEESRTELVLLVLSVLGTTGAVYLYGAAGFAGLLLVAFLLYRIYRKRGGKTHLSRSMREQDFRETGLKQPVPWEVEAVSARLQELSDELHESRRQEKLAEREKDFRTRLREKEKGMEKLEKKAAELREALGVLPGIDPDMQAGYATLYWFLTHVMEWQTRHRAILARKSAVEKDREDAGNLLEKIHSILDRYQLKGGENYAEAKARIETLEEKREKYLEYTRKIEESVRGKERLTAERDQERESLRKLCQRLGIEPEERHQIREYVQQLEDYRDLKSRIRSAEHLVRAAAGKMNDHPLNDEMAEKVWDLSPADILIRKDEAKEKAAGLDEINKNITGIETRIDQAKQRHDLEKALGEREEGLRALEELYRSNAASVAGDLLVRHLQQHIGDKNMPEVFTRAKSLFNRVTRGRYELRVSGKDRPGFRAVDTLDGIGRSLEELSTGTRIQLLMAVRLAFLEHSEGEIKLPVLADELLANSDRERAGAIIDALAEISREGRQVFYFTAQEDEVARWQQQLEKHPEVEAKVFVIEQEERQFLTNTAGPRADIGEFLIKNDFPRPGGLNYEEYRQTLDVPPFDVLSDPFGRLHLWYLFDDTETLYRTLRAGIDRWGMLKSYLDGNGVIEGLDEREEEKIKERARLAHICIQLLRHGRNRPVDRQVLEESGAVSGTFIDEVSRKLEEYHHDPGRLLKALEEGEVSGFRKHKKEELEEYLLNEGHLETTEPYSREEIRAKLLAEVSQLSLDRKEADRVIRRLLQQL